MYLPKAYYWLNDIAVLPKVVAAALAFSKLNSKEIAGKNSNPLILQLAKEAGVDNIYKNDDTAWCAVAHVALLLRAGKEVLFKGFDRLRAKSFINYGTKVPKGKEMLGDTLVFDREGGGHVGIYIAEDSTCFHTMGGNSGNQYNTIRIKKDRLVYCGRPIYKSGQPVSVKKYFVDPIGNISENEA